MNSLNNLISNIDEKQLLIEKRIKSLGFNTNNYYSEEMLIELSKRNLNKANILINNIPDNYLINLDSNLSSNSLDNFLINIGELIDFKNNLSINKIIVVKNAKILKPQIN